MNAALAAHAFALAVVASAGLASGTLAAFLAAPLVCLLALQARALRSAPASACPARSVGLAILLGAFGGGLLVTGSVAFAGLLFAGAAAVAYAGAGVSLSRLRPPASAAAEEGELALRAAVAADEALRLMIEARTLLRGDLKYADMAAEARIAADRNLEEGWEARPERAHPIPPPLEKFSCEPRRLRGVGEVEVLRFTSEFEPQDPEVRDAYLAVAPNRTAQAVLLRHGGTPRPTLIYCHGYGCGQPWLDARLSGAQRLHAELGLDVALFSLPLHGARAAGWQSGEGMLDASPLWTNAALAQAVWDLRRLTGYLRERGAPTVGVFGSSIGGSVAAVFASVDERLASVIAMNTPARLDELFWQQLPPDAANCARAAGLSAHLLAQAWSRHAPLRMRPRVAHERRLVVWGAADRVVGPGQSRELWEHWGRPALHEYPGTHTVWRGGLALRASIDAHLRATLGAPA